MLYISLLLALLAVACLIFVPNTVILLSFVSIMHGFAVYSACHALLHKRDSRAALGWIAIILFMPPVGLPLYWLFGIARIDSQAVRLMEKAAQKVMGGLVDLHGKSLTEKPEGFIDKDEVPHAWHYLVNPGSSITGRCMLEGNDLTVLHNGVLIQNNTLILGTTEFIGFPKTVAHGRGPIVLQDHLNPVRFRNIWIREL